MFNKLADWLTGKPKKPLSTYECIASIALFLIIMSCFNALPPAFSFDGAAESSSDGSLFNQVFWIGMLLISISSALNAPRATSGIYVKAMPLLIFCVLLVISALWSLAPAISLRRAILECIVVGSILVNIASLQRAEHAFVIVYRAAFVTLVFECAMLLRANGFDTDGFFRGIHTQKNVLGLVGAISIIVGFWIRQSGMFRAKHWNTAYLLTWVALLVLSRSKTSLALTLVAPAIALGLRKLARRMGVGVGVPLLVFFVVLYGAFSVVFIAGVDVGNEIERLIHRIGFTGRDDIWQFLIARFMERPWMGHGYGGFWDIGPAAPNLRYGTGFIPMINQAHNGYIDLLLALGVVGFIAYIWVFISYLFCFSFAEREKQHGILSLCWTLIVFSFIHNLTETSLVRGYALVWISQLLAMAITYRLADEARRLK